MKSLRFIGIRRLSKQTSQIINTDFFGIAGAQPDYEVRKIKNKPTTDEIAQKYSSLQVKRDALQNEEKTVDVRFGRIRFDTDNTPRNHGQFEENNEAKLFDTIAIKQEFVPNVDQVEEPLVRDEVKNFSIPSKTGQTVKSTETPKVKPRRGRLTQVLKKVEAFQATTQEGEETKLSGHKPIVEEREEKLIETRVRPKPVEEEPVYDPAKGVVPEHEVEPDIMSDEYYEKEIERRGVEFDFDRSLDKKYDVKPKVEKKPLKADEYLHRVRTKQEKPALRANANAREASDTEPSVQLDSQGFRIYSNVVTDWSKLPKDQVLAHIKSCVLYNNYDILAVNKPYGIASTDDNQKDALNMRFLVAEVAKSMRIDKVFLAHRLDKTTTGVLLFATSKEKAQNLAKLFKSNQVKKTYWCITRGKPSPEAAVIDCPIHNYEVGGKQRSCIFPDDVPDKFQLDKKFREARRAITEYRVLFSNKVMSLVEVKTSTGVKHQIRCHLGFAANCPILGDHKYSDPGKFAPQLLPAFALRALNMRQSKVRTLPVHLHAKRIVVPSAKANGEPLFIDAPLPRFFIDNLKALNLMDRDIKGMIQNDR